MTNSAAANTFRPQQFRSQPQSVGLGQPRRGRWTVATGGATPLRASRNPWAVDVLYPLFAPAGRRRFLGRRKDACAPCFRRPLRGGYVETRPFPRVAHRPPRRPVLHPWLQSAAPLGRTRQFTTASTGSASGGYAAAPLHPWLQSAAPLGRKTAVQSFRFQVSS